MKKQDRKNLCAAFGILLAFLAWTAAIRVIDVQAIGPENSTVGFAALNGFFYSLTGTHLSLYTITDWLGLVPLGFALGFAVLGLVQLIKRRSLFRVDADILVLGGFYILVLGAYILFEVIPINYRPVLIDGCLETSYPSSTTLLVLCIMPTAILQLKRRMKDQRLKAAVRLALWAFSAFMVVGRLVCGVHWLTDIVGGVLLSAGLDTLYYAICRLINPDLEIKRD